VYLLTGRYDEALELAQALPPSWRDGRNRHIEYHMQVGLALKGKRSLNAAAEHLQQAIALTEDLRQSIGEKAQFFAGGGYYRPLAPYRAIIAVLAEMDDRHVPLRGILDNTRARLMARRGIQERLSDFGSPADRAFYFSELTKARGLLEAMTGTQKETGVSDLDPTLKKREEELRTRLAALDRRWYEALKKGKEAVTSWEREREGVKNELNRLIDELRERSPRYAALHYPLPMDAKKLPLREHEVLLEYALTDEATYLFVVRKGGIQRLITIPLRKGDVEEAVKSFMEPLNSNHPDQFSREQAHRLYHYLLQEAFMDVREDERIIIVPDGILGLLPFESLVITLGKGIKDTIFVADRHPLTYYQSASILALNRMLPETQPTKSLFALGNPIYSKDDPRYLAWKEGKPAPKLISPETYAFRGLALKAKWGAVTGADGGDQIVFPSLPETETEVREIARIWGVPVAPPDILLGLAATETSCKQAHLDQYRYVHFATHASLPGMVQGVNEPFILLSQVENQGDDGFLTLSEVAGMKLTADLVALSACVTGRGREVEGEGVVNFARAFQQAGARSVLVSLWEVASNPAVQFMTAFYGHLKVGESRDMALRHAREEIKRSYPSPFYWAVFICTGNNEKNGNNRSYKR